MDLCFIYAVDMMHASTNIWFICVWNGTQSFSTIILNCIWYYVSVRTQTERKVNSISYHHFFPLLLLKRSTKNNNNKKLFDFFEIIKNSVSLVTSRNRNRNNKKKLSQNMSWKFASDLKITWTKNVIRKEKLCHHTNGHQWRHI